MGFWETTVGRGLIIFEHKLEELIGLHSPASPEASPEAASAADPPITDPDAIAGPAFSWLATWTPADRQALRDTQLAVGLDPTIGGLLAVMDHEAGGKPSALNPLPAAGLIQLTTGARLPGFTDPDAIRMIATWTPAHQLRDVVLPFYRRFFPHGAPPGVAAQGGVALLRKNFLPGLAEKPDSYVLGVREDATGPAGETASDAVAGTLTRGAIYNANKGFDSSGQGFFTWSDADRQAAASVARGVAAGLMTVGGKILPPDPKVAGVTEEAAQIWAGLSAWGQDLEELFAPSRIAALPEPPPASLSPARRKILDAVSAVVPSAYPDARWHELAPLYDPANLPAVGYTTCAELPRYALAPVGLNTRGGLSSIRDLGLARSAWVTPSPGVLPQPGDVYMLGDDAGSVLHVGLVVSATPTSWRTADAGQGSATAQAAAYLENTYDPATATLTRAATGKARKVLGWLDIDRALAAADPPMAGAPDLPTFDPVTWVPINVAGYQLQRSAEPLSVNGIRRPISFGQHLAAARALDALPLTREISRASWNQAADKRLVNPIYSPDGAHYNDPKQNAVFAAQLGPVGTVLRDGAWKEMVLASFLKPTGPGSMNFYGWHMPPAGEKIEQKGDGSPHDRNWIEYDSFGSLMKRDAIDPQGMPVDLLALLAAGSSPLMTGQLPAFLVDELGGLDVPTGAGIASSIWGS